MCKMYFKAGLYLSLGLFYALTSALLNDASNQRLVLAGFLPGIPP